MATDTAAAVTAPPAPDPTTHVWQIPVFLIGAAVFAAAWQGWLPLGTPDPAAAFTRDLAALRVAYEKATPDRDELKELLGKVAVNADAFPEQSPVAHFVLGSGYARLAELTPNLDDARGNWVLAKQHFEMVRPEQLKDPSDQPRLAFRFAKTRAAVGLPASATTADIKLHIALLANAPPGEEAGETGRLQADLAMRLSPPDTGTAKESLTKYLTATGIATPTASLARAKLQLGDIHFRRKEPEQARKWLEQIGADAPQDVVAPARALLARVRMSGEDWLGAARDWETVRTLPGVQPALKTTAAFQLGVCKLNTRENEAAAKLFDEASQGEGPEAVAAAIRLADLHLRASEPNRRALAPELLARAVKGIASPGDFKNGYVRAAELQATFDLAISSLLNDGAFEQAVKTADTYATVSAAGRERERRAEALAAWATDLKKKQDPGAKAKAIAAAEAYEALVETRPGDPAKADAYRRAAKMHTLADNPTAAVEVLKKATRLDLKDAAAPVWADLADALLATNNPEALKAFNQAMAAGSPVSTATRYRLARQFTDTRHPGLGQLGRGLFEQIAKQETVSKDEQEYHERALVELAHEFIRAGNFTEAENWLSKQLSIYTNGPEASLGRLLLGVCYLQRAIAPPPNTPDSTTTARLREESVKLFKMVIEDVNVKQKRDGKLADRDSWLRLQAGLRVLQAYQQMQRPNDLLAEAAILLERHRGSVEELIVLSLVYHAFKQKNEPGKALQTRDQMKELFDRLPIAAFPASQGEYSKAYWEKVWFSEK